MDYEHLKAFVNNEIEPYLQYIEMWQCITALGIKPFQFGEYWYFRYGRKASEIIGRGSTIDNAAWDFYTNLKTEKLQTDKPKIIDYDTERIKNEVR